MLYLTFDKPVDDKVLFDLMTENNLIKVATTPIDNEFENQIFQFKTDNFNKVLLYVGHNTKDDSCENINIALSYNNDLNKLKDLFVFLNKLDKDNIILIDQEIKNELYLKDIILGNQTLSDKWSNEQNKQAIISLSFDDFCKNNFKLANRDKLLSK